MAEKNERGRKNSNHKPPPPLSFRFLSFLAANPHVHFPAQP
jgi:hypothetical protein